MLKIIEAVRAVLEAAAADLVLEEGHEKIDQQDYDWYVHDLGALAMKSKAFIEKIKYAEVKE
tara:strand:- start:201 stop:386 length:186 start_codon:yes stop_codon:yes gene_type:complete